MTPRVSGRLRWLVLAAAALTVLALFAAATPAFSDHLPPTVGQAATTSAKVAYVNKANPAVNTGGSADCRTNASTTYTKVCLVGVGTPTVPADATVTAATLRLHTRDALPAGVEVLDVASDSWSESMVSWNTRPALGAVLAALPAAPAGVWVDVPLPDPASYTVAGAANSFAVRRPGAVNADLDVSSDDDPGFAPQLVVSYTVADPDDAAFHDALVPPDGRRWLGVWPNQTGDPLAVDLAAHERDDARRQVGVVRVFRQPGDPLWNAEAEQLYLNTGPFAAAAARHVYLGYRPAGSWATFDGVGVDDAAVLDRIRGDARRTADLYAQTGRKVFVNAVNHEAERYVTGCGGSPGNGGTVTEYHGAWRTVERIFAEEGARGAVVWAVNFQNIVKTTPASCSAPTFRGLMLQLAPRDPAGGLIVDWFGWNPYSPGPGRSVVQTIDDGEAWIDANAPADLAALPRTFGEWGWLEQPTPEVRAATFAELHTRLDAGAWPRVRMLNLFLGSGGVNTIEPDARDEYAGYAHGATMWPPASEAG